MITISAQPSNQTASGGAATFSVTASVTQSATLSYQWHKSTNGGSTFSPISGATSASLSLTGLTAGDDSSQYRVVVSATGGASSVTSSAATLTAVSFSASSVILTSGTSYTVPSGASSMKVWAVGPGGQSGSTVGHAGAVAYKTWSVSGGQSVSYSIGQRPVYSGTHATSGSTTATFGGHTITAEGGGGKSFGDYAATYYNADGGANGGLGVNLSGPLYYGGAVGGAGGLSGSLVGGRYPATDVSGLLAAVDMADPNLPFGFGGSSENQTLAGIGGGSASYGATDRLGGSGAVVIYFS